MNLQPRIQTIPGKLLVGIYVNMSLTDNKTLELWQSFMPRRKEIANNLNTDLICMQVYNNGLDFKNFTPDTIFQKWAAVEVENYADTPQGLQAFALPGGLYAIFDYRGAASDFAPTFRYIYDEWLPRSGYELDQRPHFEVLGAKYKNNNPDSEEEIWVPVRLKQ